MSTTVRIGSGNSKDNTGSVLQFENQGTKAYAASVAISTSQNVSNTLGVLDADDINITYNGSAFEAIVLYQYGTSDSDSRLIAFVDTSEGLPFPGTLDASSLLLLWNNTSTKIISL